MNWIVIASVVGGVLIGAIATVALVLLIDRQSGPRF